MIKKIKWLTLGALLLPFFVIASQTCTGKVTSIIEYPTKCDAGRYAFQMDITGEQWICAITDKTEALIMAAYMGNKRLGVRLDLTTTNDCTSINNYQVPLYISIKD